MSNALLPRESWPVKRHAGTHVSDDNFVKRDSTDSKNRPNSEGSFWCIERIIDRGDDFSIMPWDHLAI